MGRYRYPKMIAFFIIFNCIPPIFPFLRIIYYFQEKFIRKIQYYFRKISNRAFTSFKINKNTRVKILFSIISSQISLDSSLDLSPDNLFHD